MFNHSNFFFVNSKFFSLVFGIILFFCIIIFIDLGPNTENQKIMAAIAILMSVWWITEAIPLAATALLPLLLFPIFGLLSTDSIATSYFNSTIFLFLGGFIIALGMERWNLHKRIAIMLILLFGKNPSSVVLGFMVASAFISMWISNTATAIMVLPIGMAILFKLEEDIKTENIKEFSIALLLGIAYSCSIGGIATIIGTPPNLVFQRIYAIAFPLKPGISFGEWMIFVFPLSLLLLLVTWILLTKVLFNIGKEIDVSKDVIKNEWENLGKMKYEEKVVSVVFVSTALLWIFRQELNLVFVKIPGWSSIFIKSEFIDDGTVAIAMALLLFLIPSKSQNFCSMSIIDSSIFKKIPWEIVLLFGGGFALAKGFVSSGLSSLIGTQFQYLSDVPLIFLIAAISLIVTFLTELTSNTATSQIILPILVSLSIELNIDPILLMLPATLSASMAFMMPVATPPNAIVFGSGKLKVVDMAKAGLILNLIGAVSIVLYVYFVFN